MSKSKISAEPAYPIETARLSIRLLSAADEALYCDLYTNAEVMRFIGPPLSRDHAARCFRKALALTVQKTFERRVQVLTERATRQAIGISGIHLTDTQRGRAEIGTLLRTASHAQRFAPEYCVPLLTASFARPQVKELWAHVPKGHAATEHLLIKLGFSRGVDVLDSARHPAGCRWSITRAVWSKRHPAAVAVAVGMEQE